MAGKRDILFIALLAITLFVITTVVAPWLLDLRSANEPYRPTPGIPLKPLGRNPQPKPVPPRQPVEEPPLRAQPGKAALKLRALEDRNAQLLEAAVDIIAIGDKYNWKDKPLSMQARYGLKCSVDKPSAWDDLPPLDQCIVRVRYQAFADLVFGPIALIADTVTDLGDLRLQRLVSVKIKVNAPPGLRLLGDLMVIKQWPLDDLSGRFPRLLADVGKTQGFEFLLTPGRWSAFDGAYYRHEPRRADFSARPFDIPSTIPTNWRFDFEVGQEDIQLQYTPSVIVGKGSIAGIVVDVTGAPLANEPVRCVQTAPLPVPQDYCWTRTDAAGRFAFDALPDGAYVITVDTKSLCQAPMVLAQCVVNLSGGKQSPEPVNVTLAKKDLHLLVTKRGVPQRNVHVEIEDGTTKAPYGRTDVNGIADFGKYSLGAYWVSTGGFRTRIHFTREQTGPCRIELLPPGSGDLNFRYTQDGKPMDRRRINVGVAFYDRKGLWEGYGPMPAGTYEAVVEGSDFGPLLVKDVRVFTGTELTRSIELGKTFKLRVKSPVEKTAFDYELRLITAHGFEASRFYCASDVDLIEGVPPGKYQLWVNPYPRKKESWVAGIEVVDGDVQVTQWVQTEYRWPNVGKRMDEIRRKYPEGIVELPICPISIAFNDAPPVADLLCATVQILGSDHDSEVLVQWPDLLANGGTDGRTRLHARQVNDKPQLFAPKVPVAATGLVLRVPGYRDCHIVLDDAALKLGAVIVNLQKN